jgi:putative acetyltransferase
LTTLRTTSENPDFQKLSQVLELDLKILDGEQHLYYADLNKIERIQNVIVASINGLPVVCGAIRMYGKNTMKIKRML